MFGDIDVSDPNAIIDLEKFVSAMRLSQVSDRARAQNFIIANLLLITNRPPFLPFCIFFLLFSITTICVADLLTNDSRRAFISSFCLRLCILSWNKWERRRWTRLSLQARWRRKSPKGGIRDHSSPPQPRRRRKPTGCLFKEKDNVFGARFYKLFWLQEPSKDVHNKLFGNVLVSFVCCLDTQNNFFRLLSRHFPIIWQFSFFLRYFYRESQKRKDTRR